MVKHLTSALCKTFMRAQKILLARHGKTHERYRNRYIGSTDAPLSDQGKKQCRRLSETIINRFRPVACFCSPMQRTRQTAEIIAAAHVIPVRYDAGLREIDFGRWEGLSFSEIKISDPELVRQWAQAPESFQFPEGESTASFRARVCQAADKLRGHDDYLVVAHGGVIRTMICHYLDISLDNYLLFNVKPARLGVIDLFAEGGVLNGFNI